MTLYEFGMRFASPVFRVLLRIRVAGSENVPDGPLVLCANHCSNVDPVVLGSACARQLRYMAKVELFRVPLLSPLITALGAFPVRRGEGDRAAIQTAFRIIRQGGVLGMFPEGHRNKSKKGLLRFQTGAIRIAAQAGAPILPVVIVREKGVWPFRRMRVVFGKPVTAGELGFTKGDIESLHAARNKLREMMLQMLEGQPV